MRIIIFTLLPFVVSFISSFKIATSNIERLSINSRRISSDITIPRPIDYVWDILTDYNNLTTHIPNLTESKIIPEFSGPGKNRIFQKGSQNIAGFEASASLTMDMVETYGIAYRSISFNCVSSAFFFKFNGSWKLYSVGEDETIVKYTVDVKPKGFIPVMSMDHRINAIIEQNLLALKEAVEYL